MALFEQMELALAHFEMSIKFEEAFPRVVEAIETDRFKFESMDS